MTWRPAEPVRTRLLLAAGTLVSAHVLAAVPPATAAGSPGVTEDPSPVRIWAPEELGDPVTFPSVDLTTGGVVLTSVSEDLDGAAQVAEAPDTVDVVLDGNVLFAKDSDVVRPAAAKRLREVVARLRTHGPGSVRIVGHTDDLGSAAHGLDLSRRRARAVRDVVAPGLEGYAVTVEGKGEAEPRVPNVDERSRALNRRVEIHYRSSSSD